MNILIYGVGKTGSLIAYELVKEGYKLYLYDIDKEKASRLMYDLNSINNTTKAILSYNYLMMKEFDLVIVCSNEVDYEFLKKLNTRTFYIFSNVDDENYKAMIKDKKFILCGSSVNRARENLFFNERTLLGDHWREQPLSRREEIRELFNKNIKPWHYGAVYYALKEIKDIIYFRIKSISDGSIDILFPR